jgi:hypothetical protein
MRFLSVIGPGTLGGASGQRLRACAVARELVQSVATLQEFRQSLDEACRWSSIHDVMIEARRDIQVLTEHDLSGDGRRSSGDATDGHVERVAGLGNAPATATLGEHPEGGHGDGAADLHPDLGEAHGQVHQQAADEARHCGGEARQREVWGALTERALRGGQLRMDGAHGLAVGSMHGMERDFMLAVVLALHQDHDIDVMKDQQMAAREAHCSGAAIARPRPTSCDRYSTGATVPARKMPSETPALRMLAMYRLSVGAPSEPQQHEQGEWTMARSAQCGHASALHSRADSALRSA